MPSRMMTAVNNADSLYLSTEEQRVLVEYAKSLPRRMLAARQVEQKEGEIADLTIAQLQDLYPNFESYHEGGWDRVRLDLTLVLRCLVQAMLMDDPDVAKDKVLSWLRSMFESLSFSPQFVADTYSTLLEATKQELPEEAFALLEPYLRDALKYLSDFPEPAFVAV